MYFSISCFHSGLNLLSYCTSMVDCTVLRVLILFAKTQADHVHLSLIGLLQITHMLLIDFTTKPPVHEYMDRRLVSFSFQTSLYVIQITAFAVLNSVFIWTAVLRLFSVCNNCICQSIIDCFLG